MCYKMKPCLVIKDGYIFRNWPVEYRWHETKGSSSSTTTTTSNIAAGSGTTVGKPVTDGKHEGPRLPYISLLHSVKESSSKLARYVLAHSLGRCLLYPGSVGLLNKIPLYLLVNGRTRLMEDFQGKRAKLVARDGNEIDTMFVDRRKKDSFPRGARLVICCEGNGSFYELGCLLTPLRAGYSVLGWNHPGFARSTGKPYPQNDVNAMEVVVQYAVHCLNFTLPDIVIYGYSLGGYTATWAAMNYPDLGALILDASFDGLLPLAMKVIDKRWRKLVMQTVREHFNLNVGEQLCHYPGPVLLIRRTLDEITSTQFSPENIPMVKTNRANQLLLQLLKTRYPEIVSGAEEAVCHWLSADRPSLEYTVYNYLYKVDEIWCLKTLQSYKDMLGPEADFPWRLGKQLSCKQKQHLALFLAKKHMKNVIITHGRTLPPAEFQLPWKL